MGDISELRTLIVVGTLLSAFIFLGAAIPAQFVGGIDDTNSINVPSNFDYQNLLGWNSTAVFQVDYDSVNTATINGYNIRVWSDANSLIMNTYAGYYGWLMWEQDYFEWYQNGTLVSATTGFYGNSRMYVDVFQTQNDTDGPLTYDIRNSHTSFRILVDWNHTAYTSVTSAFIAGQLKLIFNANFDAVGSQLNGWTLVTGLMTFSLPDVPVYIQYPLSIGIWCALAYVAFIFVLRMIGAVFGGGGA